LRGSDAIYHHFFRVREMRDPATAGIDKLRFVLITGIVSMVIDSAREWAFGIAEILKRIWRWGILSTWELRITIPKMYDRRHKGESVEDERKVQWHNAL
jgi:hypothetical protein